MRELGHLLFRMPRFPGEAQDVSRVINERHKAHLKKLRAEAAECRLISDLATDKEKRELFFWLADHLNILAGEAAKAIDAKKAEGGS